jgi:hypothetical protein
LRRAVAVALPLLIVAIATIAATAHAEPGDAEKKAAAQALFDEARALTAEGSFAQACPKLEESVRLDPTPGSKFYLAECFERVGKLASAWTYYLDAADTAKAAGSADREKFARDRAEAVKSRISRVVVAVPATTRATPGLEVRRDGVVLGEGQWDAPIPVDPGRHVITASAPGRVAWESAIEASEPGKTLTVAVPTLLEAPKPKPARVDPPRPIARPIPPAPAPPSARDRRQIAGIVTGVVGVIGLGVGTAFGVDAASKAGKSNADGHCDAANFCDTTGLGLRHDAIGSATISTVSFVVGGALLAGGVVLVLTAPARPQAAAISSVSVAVGPGSLFISGSF